MRSKYLILSICLICTGCVSTSHEGRVANGVYDDPSGSFSVRVPFQYTDDVVITDSKDNLSRTVSFMIPYGEMHRIDYWEKDKYPLTKWTAASGDADNLNGILDAMLNFTSAETKGLQNLNVTLRRKNTSQTEPTCFAAFQMKIDSPERVGTYTRGYLVFEHGNIIYVLHYAPPPAVSKNYTGEQILTQLESFKKTIVFTDRR